MRYYIEKARDGDPAATAVMVDFLRPRITKMAAHYARACGEDRDDLLQEAWVGLLEALPELDLRIGSPEQYLIQRAKWRLLDAVKYARIRRHAPLDEELLDTTLCPDFDSALAGVCVSEFSRCLKPLQRAVLKCLLSGLTWRETGDTLGCTSANIAHHVRQIRKRYEKWCFGNSQASDKVYPSMTTCYVECPSPHPDPPPLARRGGKLTKSGNLFPLPLAGED